MDMWASATQPRRCTVLERRRECAREGKGVREKGAARGGQPPACAWARDTPPHLVPLGAVRGDGKQRRQLAPLRVVGDACEGVVAKAPRAHGRQVRRQHNAGHSHGGPRRDARQLHVPTRVTVERGQGVGGWVGGGVVGTALLTRAQAQVHNGSLAGRERRPRTTPYLKPWYVKDGSSVSVTLSPPSKVYVSTLAAAPRENVSSVWLSQCRSSAWATVTVANAGPGAVPDTATRTHPAMFCPKSNTTGGCCDDDTPDGDVAEAAVPVAAAVAATEG